MGSRAWLASELNWKTRVGARDGTADHWKGVKMLGTGGNGIVGLWQRTTPAPDEHVVWDNEIPRYIQHVAVKQQQGNGDAFYEEVDWMRKFQEAGEHTVKCYGMSESREVGGGHWPGKDDEGRMCIELFWSGVMGWGTTDILKLRLLIVVIQETLPVPTKGAALIENGTEELGGVAWDDDGELENNIVHFELKDRNGTTR
jgi:hypothetical protein